MTNSYTLEGLHCNACITRVEKALHTLPEVSSTEVTLDKATINLTAPVALETLRSVIAKVGMYKIQESQAVEA